METLEKLKVKIFQLATEKLISTELSLKFLDYISKRKILQGDAEKLLISLSTLTLNAEEIENLLNHYLDMKVTVIGKQQEDTPLEINDPTIGDLDAALDKEKKEGAFEYRERVYNYILTVINGIDEESFHFHFSHIKSENPELTENEFRKILERARKDNELLSKPYEGKTKDLDDTLDFVVAAESTELKAFTQDYVHLIQDPASYMASQVKNTNLKELLSIDEEKYYGRNLKSKEPLKRAEAKQKFTLANLRLVMHVVKRFARNDEDLVNLYEEGFLGLQKAIQKFDYARNIRFATYAIWWIRQAILRFLQTTTRTIRIPTHLVAFTTKLVKLKKKLTAEIGEAPSRSLMMDRARIDLGIEPKKFNEVYPLAFGLVKMEDIGTDEWEQIEDKSISNTGTFYIEKAEEYESQDLSNTIERLLKQLLTPKEHEVIKRRYGFPPAKGKMTLQSIADEYGVSRERIRQIEASAQKKLQSDYVRKTLNSYFESMQ